MTDGYPKALADFIGEMSCGCCGFPSVLPMAGLADYTGRFCRRCLIRAVEVIDAAAADGAELPRDD